MSLEYMVSPDQWFSASITQFPLIRYVKDLMQFIDEDKQVLIFSSSLYGFISGYLYREDQQFCSKLIHEFILRIVDSGKTNEIWIKLHNHFARFGIQEYCLITGLPCHEVTAELDSSDERLRNIYFHGTKRITMVMLSQAFHECEHAEDKFKLGLVMLVECILKPVGRYIDYKTLGMVENLDEFLVYPWGRISYFVLLNSLQQRSRKLQNNQQTDRKYSIHGFPLAFQCWIYEAFPNLGQQFGRRRHRTLQFPRIHKWKPNKFLTEKVIRDFLTSLADEEIEVIPILIPTEEESETPWYITLSLPPDNEHHVLDTIIDGTFNNVTAEIPFTDAQEHQTNDPDAETSFEFEMPPTDIHDHQTNVPGAAFQFEPGPSTFQFEPGSSSSRGDYVTREHMEELFGIYKQHLVSEMSNLYNNLKADMIQDSRNHEARYQTILNNQTQLFEQQKQSQQDIQSMRSFIDTSINSIRSSNDERDKNMLDHMSFLKSNMESVISSLRHDAPINKSRGGEQSLSSFISPLEDFSEDKYTTITNWIESNPSDEYWDNGIGYKYRRDMLLSIQNTSEKLDIANINAELTMLRRLVHDKSPRVSKEHAILDFSFDEECTRSMIWQNNVRLGLEKGNPPNSNIIRQYVSGILPIYGIPWKECNYLLIPSTLPVNNWYLYLVDIRQWEVQIYDCSQTMRTPDEIKLHAKPTLLVVEGILAVSGRQELRKYANKNMAIRIIPCFASKNSGPNCGVFVLKYIECLIFGQPVDSISLDKMNIYRRKIAVDLAYNEYFLRSS